MRFDQLPLWRRVPHRALWIAGSVRRVRGDGNSGLAGEGEGRCEEGQNGEKADWQRTYHENPPGETWEGFSAPMMRVSSDYCAGGVTCPAVLGTPIGIDAGAGWGVPGTAAFGLINSAVRGKVKLPPASSITFTWQI